MYTHCIHIFTGQHNLSLKYENQQPPFIANWLQTQNLSISSPPLLRFIANWLHTVAIQLRTMLTQTLCTSTKFSSGNFCWYPRQTTSDSLSAPVQLSKTRPTRTTASRSQNAIVLPYPPLRYPPFRMMPHPPQCTPTGFFARYSGDTQFPKVPQ